MFAGIGVGVGHSAFPADVGASGQEYSPDPGFDNSAAWTTKVRCTVSGSALNYTGLAAPLCQGPAAATIVAGTYRASGVMTTGTGLHNVSVFVGGSPGFFTSNPGPFSVDIVVASVADQNIKFGGTSGGVSIMESCSVKLLAAAAPSETADSTTITADDSTITADRS